MSQNLYVGNLPFQTTPDDLVKLFGDYGTVSRAQVVSDRNTGRSRGFAFVVMGDGGETAIATLNGSQFQGRTLTVNEAKPREARPPVSSRDTDSAVPNGNGYGRRDSY